MGYLHASCTLEAYTEWQRFHYGRHKERRLRLGQAFVNDFLAHIRGEATRTLFYADDSKALSIIAEQVVFVGETEPMGWRIWHGRSG